ncbi:MAG: hypothetical protein U0T78_03585 [Cloacibacterium normanense]
MIDFRDYKIGTDLNLEKQKYLLISEYKTLHVEKRQNWRGKVVGQDDFVN